MVAEVRLTVDRQQVTSQITRFWVSAARQRFAAETAQIGGSGVSPIARLRYGGGTGA